MQQYAPLSLQEPRQACGSILQGYALKCGFLAFLRRRYFVRKPQTDDSLTLSHTAALVERRAAEVCSHHTLAAVHAVPSAVLWEGWERSMPKSGFQDSETAELITEMTRPGAEAGFARIHCSRLPVYCVLVPSSTAAVRSRPTLFSASLGWEPMRVTRPSLS